MKPKTICDTKISKILSLHTWHSFNMNNTCNMILNVIDESFENKYTSTIKDSIHKFVTANKYISKEDKDTLQN